MTAFSSLDDIIGRLKSLTILGSTGSIGVSTLDVIGRHPEQYRIHALVAGHNVDVLTQQILRFRPDRVVTATNEIRESLSKRLTDSGLARRVWPELLYGPKARVEAATGPEVDFVMSAIVGVAGLEATYEAIRCGKRIGLANKEVLVASGKLVIDAARKSGTELIPVDSEHNGAPENAAK
jgi:1-deoxy-D-xylulose-5-phosphate reductoisomerase